MVGWTFETCLQYGLYFDNSNDFSGMTIWNMSVYVHLCRSMGDMLVIQKILVGWIFETCPFMSIYVAVCFFFIIDEILKNLHLCPFMLQYGWYCDNSKDFSGMKIWNMSMCFHLCCSMGDIFIIQSKSEKKHLPELKKYSMYMSGIFYVHVFFQFLKIP